MSNLSEIPGWKKALLESLGGTYTGLSGKTKDDFGEGKPFITYMNVFSNSKIKPDQVGYVKISEEESQSKVQYGDILFTTSSETVDEVGMTSVMLSKDLDEVYLNSFCFGFRLHDFSQLLPEYASFLFRSEAVRKTITVLSQGSTRFNLSKTALLKKLWLELPPLSEQQKIAEILSTVEEKIEVIEEKISKTQEMKKGMMKKLFNPSWQMVTLESISDFITKGSTPTTYGFDWVNEGVIFLRSECVGVDGFTLSGSMKISDEANKAMERSQIQEGDILMTITGNVGRVCIYPTGLGNGNINQHIAKIRISNKRVIPNFVYYFLSQSGVIKNYNKITTGQAYPQLSLKQVRETLVPLPSQKEQLLVCKMLEATDQNIEILKEKFKNYNSLKIGLMQNLLTGTIRVNSLLQKENLA